VEDAVSDGYGLVRVEGKVYLVEQALPGDIVTVEVFRGKKRLGFGRVIEWHETSPERVAPHCPHSRLCGGCSWQEWGYKHQLRMKEQYVFDCANRIGKLEGYHALPIIGADTTREYRNKVEFSFSNRRWLTTGELDDFETLDQRSLGYHVPRHFDKVLPIEHCALHRPDINAIRNAIFHHARQNDLTFYDYKAHTGWLRNVLFRASEATAELLVLLIVGYEDPTALDALFTELRNRFSSITSLLWMVNPKKNDSYSDLTPQPWYGNPFIIEKLGNYRFKVSPTSFFQTNTRQAERLYTVVRELLPPEIPMLYDLYCGTGSIGLFVSDRFRQGLGIEYVESAVPDARVNAELNGIRHLAFVSGNLGKMFSAAFFEQHPHPTHIVLDPPRAGLDPLVVRQLPVLAPQEMVYVSCNPATLARDLELLNEHFCVRSIQPVDMFPHTRHVEAVAHLVRRS
jgi:23S rRNA (uracil1939-C5)-methyltransferase